MLDRWGWEGGYYDEVIMNLWLNEFCVLCFPLLGDYLFMFWLPILQLKHITSPHISYPCLSKQTQSTPDPFSMKRRRVGYLEGTVVSMSVDQGWDK